MGAKFLICHPQCRRGNPWKDRVNDLNLKICYETAGAIFIHHPVPCGPEYESADMKAK